MQVPTGLEPGGGVGDFNKWQAGARIIVFRLVAKKWTSEDASVTVNAAVNTTYHFIIIRPLERFSNRSFIYDVKVNHTPIWEFTSLCTISVASLLCVVYPICE